MSFLKRIATSLVAFSLITSSIMPSISPFATSIVQADDSEDKKEGDSKETDSNSTETKSSGNESGNKVSSDRATRSDGSANGRVNTFLNFAAGKEVDESTLQNLTKDQMRFLGVLLSNFYSPWKTDLGSSEEDKSSTGKKALSETLEKEMGFNKNVAESFAKEIVDLGRGSVEELTIQFKKEQKDKETKKLDQGHISKNSVTYADLLILASGYAYRNKKDLREFVGEKYGSDEYRYAYLGYGEGSNFKPVFGFDTRAEDNTASMVAFLKALEMAEPQNGYGFFALDFNDKDFGGEVTLENLDKIAAKITSDEEWYNMSTYGAKIGVDAFGNLLWMGSNHQYVMLPGAMNPFTWQRLDKNGKEYGQAGNALNITNAQLLSLIAKGELGSVSPHPEKEEFYSLEPTKKWLLSGEKTSTFEGIPLIKMSFIYGTSVDSTDKGFLEAVSSLFGNNELNIQKAILDKYFSLRGYENSFLYDGKIKEATMWAFDYYFELPIVFYGDGDKANVYSDKPADPVNLMGGIVFLDKLGAHGSSSDTGDSSEDSYGSTDDKDGQYNLLQKGDLIKKDGSGFMDQIDGTKLNVSDTVSFGNKYRELKDKGLAQLGSEGTAKTFWEYLYATYAVAGLAEGKLADGNVGYKLNSDLPELPDEGVELTDGGMSDLVTKAIRDWLYYLLHPTEGVVYFKTWLTTKINAFLLSIHDGMVGTEGVGVLPGTSRYIGFSGYVTTPEMVDMAWTNALVEFYQSIIIYIIILIFVIMSSYTILGMLTIQKALLGLILFSIFAYAPITVVNTAVYVSNKVSNAIFGDRFSYWGIVQQQSYFAELADSINNKDYQNYLADLYVQNAKESGNQGGDNMVLRWQAPKKMANLVLSSNERQTYSTELLQVLKVLTNAKDRAESFTENTNQNYMYRSYTDIANVSMFMYGDFVSNGQTRDDTTSTVGELNTIKWSSSLQESWQNFTQIYTDDRANGYAPLDSEGSRDGSQAYRVRLPLTGKIYSDASSPETLNKMDNLQLTDYLGIDQRFFKFSIALLNSGSDLVTELSQDGFDPTAGGIYSNADIKSLAAYGIMSENPFYYFSWDLYDQGLASNATSKEGFRDLLLSKSDSGYFYNVEKNNEMRDYLDLRTMFTYLIPYLKQGNDIVREWDKRYGIFFYEGVTYEEGHEEDPDIASNPELAQKYWHNVNVARLYNIYTPWVDLMYDTSYVKPEKIAYQGQKYIVEDPLDPRSYPTERPMVFSRSEMFDYGLKDDQLTTVERKIMNVSKRVFPRWYKLLNYYTFTDVALNTSAAMEAAFVFNQEFSEAKLVGDNINIYPQSFELKNFTYDAFLRMILSTSTGESLIADEGEKGNLYERVIDGSSMITTILLLILDVIAVYFIPLIKLVILISIFLSSILMVIVLALSVNRDIGKQTLINLSKAVLIPSGKFLALSVTMSWLVSLFISEGATGVTGATVQTIALGDPAFALIAMLALNLIVVYLYIKIFLSVFKALKKYGGSIMEHISSVIVGGVSMLASGAVASGAVVKAATKGTVKATAGTAKATYKGAKGIDNRFGITNKGARHAYARAEQKAHDRLAKQKWKKAQKEVNRGGLLHRGNRRSDIINRDKEMERIKKQQQTATIQANATGKVFTEALNNQANVFVDALSKKKEVEKKEQVEIENKIRERDRRNRNTNHANTTNKGVLLRAKERTKREQSELENKAKRRNRRNRNTNH